MAVIVIARYFILEASARYVLVTGESLLTGYGRIGRWIVWLIFLATLVKRHLFNLHLILLIGIAADLLVPLGTSWSQTFWSLLFWGLGFALMYWGKYRMVEAASKPLFVLLAASLAAAAFFSYPDPGAVAKGALIPSIPADQGVYNYAFVLMALAGSSAGSLSNLKYAAFVHQKGWRDLSFLKLQRTDLMLSVFGLFVMSALIQIAAGGTLRPLEVRLENVEDLVPMFAQVLGDAGRIVLAVGLWAVIFTTYLGSNTGYSLMVTDIYHTFICPSNQGEPSGAAKDLDSQAAYRWCLIWYCVSPLYVLLTDWKPLWLVLLSASLFVVLLPVIVLVLMKITNDRRLMGEHVNGLGTNAVLVSVIVLALFLTYENAVELWGSLMTYI